MAGLTIGFESNDFSEFDTAPVGTSFTISGAAAYIGTYGLEIDMAGTSTTTGVEVTAMSGTFTQLRTGAWLNIENLVLSTSQLTQCLNFIHSGDDMGIIALHENGSGTINGRVNVQDDAGSNSELITIPQTGWFHVEVIMTQAATNVSSDGVYEIKVNGVQDFIDSAMDNYDYFVSMQGSSFEFRLYPIAAEAGVTGDMYIDHIQWNDDGTTLYNPPAVGETFGLKVSQGGLYRHAMAVTPDGENLAFALELDPSGDQIVSSQTRPTDAGVSTTQRLYTPGGGTAGNVAAPPDIDKIIAFGDFGTNLGVISIVISTVTATDISPASLGADVIQPAAVDPSDTDHIVIINQTDQDAIETTNGGTTWTTLNATLAQTVEALDVVFFGQYLPFSAFFGGDDATDENLEYTPNAFANFREDTSASLKAANAITGIAIVVDYGN